MLNHKDSSTIYGTTILSVRKNNQVAIAGDGQVSLGSTVLKSNASATAVIRIATTDTRTIARTTGKKESR